MTLGDTEPVSHEPGPGAGIEERAAIEAIKQALGRLPRSLQVPLRESVQGRPASVIAEDFGVSESTARRRIQEARDAVRDELAPHVDGSCRRPLRDRHRSGARTLTAPVRGDVRAFARPRTEPGPGEMRPSFDREPRRPPPATAPIEPT